MLDDGLTTSLTNGCPGVSAGYTVPASWHVLDKAAASRVPAVHTYPIQRSLHHTDPAAVAYRTHH